MAVYPQMQHFVSCLTAGCILKHSIYIFYGHGTHSCETYICTCVRTCLGPPAGTNYEYTSIIIQWYPVRLPGSTKFHGFNSERQKDKSSVPMIKAARYGDVWTSGDIAPHNFGTTWR
jgi:hypothetical protein